MLQIDPIIGLDIGSIWLFQSEKYYKIWMVIAGALCIDILFCIKYQRCLNHLIISWYSASIKCNLHILSYLCLSKILELKYGISANLQKWLSILCNKLLRVTIIARLDTFWSGTPAIMELIEDHSFLTLGILVIFQQDLHKTRYLFVL